MRLDGSEAIGLNRPDNMAIETHGNLVIQEEPGEYAHLARVLAYRLSTGVIAELATFDAERFALGAAGFITDDEESSGIIDTKELLGDGTFLFDAQVRKAHPDLDQVVGYGRLLRLKVIDWVVAYQERQPAP